jgi:hypothetical protein
MKTIEQIKTEILASNPSKKYILNGEEFEQTLEEFEIAVQARAEMDFYFQQIEAEAAAKKAAAEAKLAALGLTAEDLRALGL